MKTSRRRSRGAIAFAFAACLFAPGSSRADDARARAARLFDEGEHAFTAGAYARAAELFEQAYAAEPHPSALFNAAQARARAGDRARAAQHYARLADDPTAAERDDARRALSGLAPALGRVVITGAEDASVDASPVDVGRTTWVEPGSHSIEGHVLGKPEHERVRVPAGEVVRVRLGPPPEADRRAGVYLTYGLGLATITSGGLLAWSGLDVLAQKRQFDRTQSDQDLDEGLARQRRTNLIVGVTVGLALVTGLVALLTWPRSSPASTASARPRDPFAW